ncbi:MAG: PLP-dependent aminotransferase family protein, partial [Gemmatimonadaceae bacterium]
MRTWEFAVSLDRGDELPLFLKIARAIAEDVRRGRLAPGNPLPGSRSLARLLKVHRNTVLAAYRELVAEGWITTSPARGTFISRALPDTPPRRFAPAAAPHHVSARVGYDLAAAPRTHRHTRHPPGTLMLYPAVPDVTLVPVAELTRAYRRAVRAKPRSALGYTDPEGSRRLRTALATMVAASRGLAVSHENVLVTRGSQMALALVARVLIAPGDAVAVEALGYRRAWDTFRLAGARLVSVPVDHNGLRVDALRELAACERIRAVFLTPHHQYPTTVTLSAGRRLELLDFAQAQRVAIIEDDFDHEFHYDGRPVLPLASIDRAGVVIYLGTLSKVLAPGLRIGYIVAPVPLLESVAMHRLLIDVQGDHGLEEALAELLENGEVQRHIRRARRVYLGRRDALVGALRAQLDDALTFSVPSGGMAVWARATPGIDVDAWAARAAAKGVVFETGKHFALDGRSKPYVRLGFAALSEASLGEA